MRVLLTLIVIPSLALLGFLIPQWTTPATLVYVGLWIIFGGVTLAAWIPAHAIAVLRVSALVLGLFYIFAAIDTILGIVQTGQSPSARNPVFGFLIIGLPALLFAIRGPRHPLDDDHPEPTDPEAEPTDPET